ncbi:hypothetical protein HNV12_08125 [Methanococcoides sp. SA1]|nr:hypothetical protein [Methanococcoides sp. SA1]
MMSLFVFLVLLFGVLGIFVSQYMVNYREAYALWINECVYINDENKESCKHRKMICSKIESYSREICGLARIIHFLAIVIAIMGVIIIYVIEENISLLTDAADLNIIQTAQIFTLGLMIILVFTLYFANINLLTPTKTSAIDDKLFEIWHKHHCFENKVGE